MYFAREEWDDPELLAGAKRLFHPSKPSYFIHWAVVLVLQFRGWTESLQQWEMIELIQEIVDESFRPLHFAATLSLPEIISAFLMEIDHQDAETLFEKTFKCAINVLNGGLRHDLRRYPPLEIPEKFRRHVGTAAMKPKYTMKTITALMEYFETSPEGMIGFSIRCWARTADFSVAQLLLGEGQTLAQSDLDQFSEEMQGILNDERDYWQDGEIDALCDFCKYLSWMID